MEAARSSERLVHNEVTFQKDLETKGILRQLQTFWSNLLPLSSRQQILPQSWYTCEYTTLHGVTSQKTEVFILGSPAERDCSPLLTTFPCGQDSLLSIRNGQRSNQNFMKTLLATVGSKHFVVNGGGCTPDCSLQMQEPC